MADDSVGVYVHVPFCERVCPYCDFAVVPARRLAPEHEDRYLAGLLRELAARAPDFAGRRLASVYLGGGTPSLLRPDSVARLLEAVTAVFDAAGAEPEVTLEANPSTLERERLPGFRAAGVNRLSLGVQSFDDGVLKRLGRAHRAVEAHRSLEAARAAGFANLSLDLITAAPGQTLAHLDADLDAVLAFGPEHVSAYGLTLEEGTPFARAHARGQLALPDEELAARMYERVPARLAAGGYRAYELSSLARPGREAVHNRRYWERRPVLGLGVGAWSSEPSRADAPHGARRANPRSLPQWLARVEAGQPAWEAPEEVPDPATARGEAMFLALRTVRGLDARAFAEEFGSPPRAFFADAIERLAAGELLHEGPDGDLRLTPRGRLLSDGVFELFVAGSD